MKVSIECLGGVTYSWENMDADSVAQLNEAFDNGASVLVLTQDIADNAGRGYSQVVRINTDNIIAIITQ